jgi:cytoskeletal protein CcmA (bactofilin family)
VFNKSKPNHSFSFLADGFEVKGEIICNTQLQLDGVVNGHVNAKHLVIGASGKVFGNINADKVEIKGLVEGEITAEQVVIEKTATVHGNVIHDTLSMEAGAIVEGSLTHKHQAASVTPIATKKSAD